MLKTKVLYGLGKTNTSEAEYDKKQIPSGKKWKVLEVRIYVSRVANDNEVYLNKITERLTEFNSQVVDKYTKPYPLDVEIGAGETLRLTGKTDGTATDYMVELIVDETGE